MLAHDDFRTVAHSTRWLGDHGKDAARAPVGPPPEVEVLGRWYRIPRFSDDRCGGATRRQRWRRDPDRRSAVAGASGSGAAAAAGDGRVTAPMQGTVTMVDVVVGDSVSATHASWHWRR